MDKSNLKLRGHAWYTRLTVPMEHRAAVGKAGLVKALNTRDLSEGQQAQTRGLIAAMQATVNAAVTRASLPADSARFVLQVAQELRAEVPTKAITHGEATEQLDVILDSHIAKLGAKHGVDEQGHARVGGARSGAAPRTARA